ncbi:hypothetical protein HC251_17490 [Iamia sp. SCSIO 61187]|uniref:hypothetical protein n=1 Tax=Iamia sp. SCSIO 61187 TaxID=2722752 RepID=UPI001C6266DC|nr:hypothetical protein [Iamia sp. SCSIO 61187]QYG94054.1 hypothetical protein HC251_17490 [Iamia sp. SCSIO 61187]
MSATVTRIEGVTDGVDGGAVTIELGASGGGPVAAAPIDGRGWIVLPGLHDGDQSWPVPDLGVRPSDRLRALTGGSLTVTTGWSWDRIAPWRPAEVAAALARERWPRLVPVLTVPREGSDGFPAWLARNRSELCASWPPVCRLFSSDPCFATNLDAVWAAGLRAAVFCSDDDARDDLLGSDGGPVHLRHARSAAEVDAARARPDTTVQTSPHLALALVPSVAAGLDVRPAVPGDPARSSLRTALDRVTMLATDHKAPVAGQVGPGLDVAATLLPAVLTLAEEGPIGLADLLPAVTTGPARLFGQDAGRAGRIVVDPTGEAEVRRSTDQEPQRAPYVGRRLRGRVVAVEHDGEGFLL